MILSVPFCSYHFVPYHFVLEPIKSITDVSVQLYSPLSKLISSSSVDHHLYADGTQLFIPFSPHTLQDVLNHISSTITQISAWMATNLLCLNPSKTEFLIIRLREQLSKLTYSTDPSRKKNRSHFYSTLHVSSLQPWNHL